MKYFLRFIFFSSSLFAQTYVLSGIVSDSTTGELLSSSNVFIDARNIGTTTDKSGKFSIDNLLKDTYNLKISFLGYQSKTKKVTLNADTIIQINLIQVPITLSKMVIEGTSPRFRETAVAFTELSARDINNRLGSKEAINILEGTPSAFISQQGGGIGEHRLKLRGFDQTNIAVMLNGIPINNPENGEIYWSNWVGISDLIKYVHVQRGLSAVPYSTSAIGGNVNIVTFGPHSSSSEFILSSEFGSYNLRKYNISFSNELSNGIYLTGLLSKRTTDGYADQVFSDEFTYYLALNMLLKNHSLQIQFFGSPQKHGQRLTPQTQNTWARRGKDIMLIGVI